MNKYSVRSFAAGLFIATAILSYFHFQTEKTTSSPVVTSPPQAVNENDIQTYVTENDMVLITEEEFAQLQAQVTEAETEAETEQEKAEERTILYQIQLDVPQGTGSQHVANRLVKAKIISSSDEFMNYLKSNGLEMAVKSGSYELNSDMELSEIVELLTK